MAAPVMSRAAVIFVTNFKIRFFPLPIENFPAKERLLTPLLIPINIPDNNFKKNALQPGQPILIRDYHLFFLWILFFRLPPEFINMIK